MGQCSIHVTAAAVLEHGLSNLLKTRATDLLTFLCAC